MYLVQISNFTSVSPTDHFCGPSQLLRANSGRVSLFVQDHVILHPVQLIILTLYGIYCVVAKSDSVRKHVTGVENITDILHIIISKLSRVYSATIYISPGDICLLMDTLIFNVPGYKTTHRPCIKPQTPTSYTTIDGAYVHGVFSVPRT